MTAAYEARFEAWKGSKAAGDIYLFMLATVKLVITLRSQGQLHRTIEVCQQQIQFAHDYGLSQTPLNGLLLIIWAEVLAELNDLDGAKKQADKGTELTGRGVDLTISGWGYMCLMRILYSRGELAGIEEIIQKIEDIDRKSNVPPWIMNQILLWQARLWLSQNKLQAASQWTRERNLSTDSENKPHHEITYFSLFDYVVLARIRIAEGQLNEAIELLYHLLTAAESGGRTSRVIEILILLALAMQAQEKTDQAITVLEQALAHAETEGFIRIFVDEGLPMARLLYEALSRRIAPDYVRRLLAAFPVAEPEQADLSEILATNSELIEPLSERELEVLQHIAEGLPNPEIASRLYLSLNTVKVHARNIYGKLNVHSRTQAIARSRELGILPTI